MGELVAALTGGPAGGQQPVHGAHRTQVAPLVEQRGMHGRRGRVSEAFAVEHRQQGLVFLVIERQRGPGARCPGRHGSDQRQAMHPGAMAGRGATRQAQRPAGGACAQHRGEFLHGGHHDSSVLSIGVPSKAASFWTSMTSSALSRRLLRLSRSRVSWAMCRLSAR